MVGVPWAPLKKAHQHRLRRDWTRLYLKEELLDLADPVLDTRKRQNDGRNYGGEWASQ